VSTVKRRRKKVIHVNQHRIKHNRKTGEKLSVITVKDYKQNAYGHTASIKGPDGEELARVVYRPDQPLSCGAHVWIETRADVVVEDTTEGKEITI
jgi:hypothetical protein